MSWVSIWVHLVFSTKKRMPLLQTKEIRYNMFQHMKENAKEKDIWLDSVNGYSDHVHCLLSLGKEQSISKISQLIKGESSFWINKSQFNANKFVWQDDYWAVGVSESHVKGVRKYIHQQEIHHKKVSFTEEIDEFMERYDWTYCKG
ncbi:MAG: IS200/IS605 family transposase [Balneolaceae bacterium]